MVVISRIANTNMAHLRQVVTLPLDPEVTLNLKKRSFSSDNSSYLVHVIRHGGRKLSAATTISVRKVKDRTTETTLRSFWSLCNVFRQFSPNLSGVALSLNKKPRNEQHKSFSSYTKALQEVVQDLKILLTNPAILAFPRTPGQYSVNTDRCDSQVKCILLR